MKNKNEMRWELRVGLLLLAVSLVLRQFCSPPDFLMCFLLGATFTFELLAIIPEPARRKMKTWKQTLFAKNEK